MLNINTTRIILALFLSALIPQFSFAQEEIEEDTKYKKFQIGFVCGSYFANSSSAKIYEGYGFDIDGKRNEFVNSIMYRRIVLESSAAYGGNDQIATALNVDPGEWTFDETDMPVNMKYNTAFQFGLNARINFSEKDAFLMNVNFMRLNAVGNFTIGLKTTQNGVQIPGQKNIKTFTITGGEQRLNLQLGYQRLMGEPSAFNLFYELGGSLLFTQFEKSQAMINTYMIDMTSYFDQSVYGTSSPENLSGIGLGFFAGAGFNISLNKRLVIQLLYQPAFDMVNIGDKPKHSWQHTAAFRAYGSF